jgi:hypothetical protein
MARVRAGLRIVLLTQDMRKAAVELARLRSEVQWVRAELGTRGVAWPEPPCEEKNGKKAA